jgi:type III secretory pathway component EscS
MDFTLSPMNYLMQGMWSAAILAGPPLLMATGVGLVIALIQTLIQLQEQTLPVAVKLLTVSSVLLMIGYKLVSPLYVLTVQIFTEFPAIAR